MKKFDYYLKGLPWQEIHNCRDTNEAFDQLHDYLVLLLNQCFPFNLVKRNIHSNKNLSWLTKGLRVASKTKRKLRLKFYKTKNFNDKSKYKTYNKLFKACIDMAKKSQTSHTLIMLIIYLELRGK